MVGAERDIGSEDDKKERSLQVARNLRLARKIGCGATSAVLTAFTLSIAYEEVTEPHIRPSIVRIDSKEECIDSVTIAVYLSGTGLQTAKWSARNNHDIARENKACSFVVDYGNRYDMDSVAEQLVEAVEESLEPNQRANLVFIGNSLGGISAQKLANSDPVRNSSQIHVAGFFFEGAPSSDKDLKGFVENGIVQLSREETRGGPIPIWSWNLYGIFDRRDNIFDMATWQDFLTNSNATNSRLISQESVAIKQGYPEALPPKEGDEWPEYRHAFSSADAVINPETAIPGIRRKIGGATLELVLIPAVYTPGALNHGDGWRMERMADYGPHYEKFFRDMQIRNSPPRVHLVSGGGSSVKRKA